MSDSDSDSVQRPKKQLSEAKLAAIEKMKEGRKRSLEAKKKQREEEKEAKKQLKKQIKLRVEEEMSGQIISLPMDDKEFMDDLKKKAIGEVKIDETQNEVKEVASLTAKEDIVGEILKEQPFSSATESHSVDEKNESEEEEVIETKQPIKKRKPRKKKVVVNNYYDEDDSEEEIEEVVNNFHNRRKKKVAKPRPIESESEDEVIEEYVEELPATLGARASAPILYRQNTMPMNAMSGIMFR